MIYQKIHKACCIDKMLSILQLLLTCSLVTQNFYTWNWSRWKDFFLVKVNCDWLQQNSSLGPAYWQMIIYQQSYGSRLKQHCQQQWQEQGYHGNNSACFLSKNRQPKNNHNISACWKSSFNKLYQTVKQFQPDGTHKMNIVHIIVQVNEGSI